MGAIIFRGEEVLLARRGQEPALDTWSIPGGLVEVGETLEEALRREVQEETGLSVTIRGITAVLDRIFHDRRGYINYHYVLVDYLCDYAGGEPASASDITAAQFVPLGDLARFDLPPFTTAVIHRAWEQKKKGTYLGIL